MKLEIEVSQENESTESPWWVILDPRQMMGANYHDLASMISGPFFSRASAQQHLAGRRYAFGKNAVVYCMSGYPSHEYKSAYRAALAQSKQDRDGHHPVCSVGGPVASCHVCKNIAANQAAAKCECKMRVPVHYNPDCPVHSHEDGTNG